MSEKFLSDYLKNRAFYKVQSTAAFDNPDQRISIDVQYFPALSCRSPLRNGVLQVVHHHIRGLRADNSKCDDRSDLFFWNFVQNLSTSVHCPGHLCDGWNMAVSSYWTCQST